MRLPTLLLVSLLAVPLLVSCSGDPGAPPAPTEAEVTAARERASVAAGKLMSNLLPRLLGALEEGGPTNAVSVCAEVAQDLTVDVGAAEGLQLRRTALRVRNPKNAPDEFERRVLESWASSTPEPVAEVVQVEGGHELRFLSPIMTAKLCLQCHGSSEETAGIAALLQEHYPEDEAVDFAEGDLRGAVSVRVPLER